MRHAPDCPWLLDVNADCRCAADAYLATATDDERAAWDAAAAQSPTRANHLLNVSETQWRRSA